MRPPHSTLLRILLPVAFALAGTAQGNWTDKSPHETEFITANGIKLHYLDWGGKGETILFLHGLGDTAHIFDDLAPSLQAQQHVLRQRSNQTERDEVGCAFALEMRQNTPRMKARLQLVLVRFGASGSHGREKVNSCPR